MPSLLPARVVVEPDTQSTLELPVGKSPDLGLLAQEVAEIVADAEL